MENNLINFLKNKLTGKQYALRVVNIFIFSFVFSRLLTSNFEYQTYLSFSKDNTNWIPFLNHAYLIGLILGAVSLISLLLTGIYSIQRTRDIVPDAPLWPYALAVLLVGLIPLIGFFMYLILIFLPSDYLNEAKRMEIVGKFA